MRIRSIVLAVLLASCGDGGGEDAGAGRDAGGDAGRALRDAGCGPVAPSGSAPECVMETCFGGQVCVNGPCPLPCCVGGRLMECDVADGFECATPPPMDCGGGTCVQAGEPCP